MLRKLFGTMLILALSPALAGDLSYNYIELGYQKAELDDNLAGFDVDGDGLGIRGAFEVSENWFVTAGYSALEFDFGVDLDQLSFGGGYHTVMSDRTDIFVTLSYLSAEVSASGFGSVDEDGYGASVGLRSMVSDQVELNGSIGYSDLGDGADGTAFSGGALYNFTENFSLGFEIGIDEDVTLYAFGARFYFDN